MNGSVRPSVCPSVTPFSLCLHHRIIMKFVGVITNGRSEVRQKGQGQTSKVKEMMHNAWRGLGEVPYCFSWSSVYFQGHTGQKKIADFDPNLAFPDCISSLNSPMALKWCAKHDVVKKRCNIVFQCHVLNLKVTRDKNSPILTRI